MYNKVSKVINRFFTFFTKNITKIVYPFLENKGKVNRTCNWGFNPLTSRGPLSIFYSCNNPLLFCPMIQGIRLGNIRQTTNSLITQYLPGFLNFAWAMSVMGQDIPPYYWCHKLTKHHYVPISRTLHESKYQIVK